MEIKVVHFLVSLLVVTYHDLKTPKSVNAKESDETALHEALLLVELLKSEYSKILRERNQPLRNEIDVDGKDLETCATTLMTNSATEAMSPLTENAGRKVEFSSPKPFSAYGFLQSQPNYFQRRRFNGYRDYYGNYNPPQMWRRMDYENVFGPQPNATTSSSQAIEKTTVPNIETSTDSTTQLPSSITTTTKGQDSQSTLKPPTTAKQNTVSSPKPLTTPSSATALTTHKTILVTSKTNNKSKNTKAPTVYQKKDTKGTEPKKLNLNLEEITSPVPITDPEQAQVVSELEQELESEIVYSSSTLSPSSRWHMTWRPTTRIHLAGSTRYPIPLPVNHAYCYTNPESPLCRTFIK